jgi:hypothetical protein
VPAGGVVAKDLKALAAPGSQITLRAGGRTQTAFVQAGSGYFSTSPPSAMFGLGAATRVDAIEVRYPDGTRRAITDVAAGRTVTITR